MDTIIFTSAEQQVLQCFGVTGVILFGSQARGGASEKSDYDIGILRSGHSSPPSQEKAQYEALYDMLSQKIGKLVNIDIVFLDAAPLELCHHAAKYGSPIYEEHPQTVARFKEMVMDRYADFAPYRRMFQEQMLRRIPS